MRNKIGKIFLLMAMCFIVCACGKKAEEEKEQADRTISRYEMPGLLGYCVDEAGEYLYCTVKGSSSIYQYGTDGSFIQEIAVVADAEVEDVQVYSDDLTSLCIHGNSLYCFRERNGCLIEINTETGEGRVCGRLTGIPKIRKMAAQQDTLLLFMYPEMGVGILRTVLLDLQTGEFMTLAIESPIAIASGAEGDYWIEACDDNGFYFQKYNTDTNLFSEQYRTNFVEELSDIAYVKEENAIYGYMPAELQYVRLVPEQALIAARFPAQRLYWYDSNMMMAGVRLFVSDPELGNIYSFEPRAYVEDNTPLKGYVLDLANVPDWSGYNIDLEEMTWDALALKVLAGDSDYDFVVLNTNMAEAIAIRDAMAYYPIPENRIARYLKECYPFVREAATYRGDIWMLPVNLYASGVVYREDNLAEYSIRMEDIRTYEELCVAARALYDAGQSDRFDIGFPNSALLKEYIRLNRKEGTVDFDTEEFRRLLDFVKGEYGARAEFRNSGIKINYMDYLEFDRLDVDPVERNELIWTAFLKTVCFEQVIGYNWDYEKYEGKEGFHVCGVPTLSGEKGTYPVLADIIIINPNAPNLEAVLDFVEDMSNNYIAVPGRHLSAEKSIYGTDAFSRDVYALYGNGEIDFELPDELFTSYYSYIAGEITDKEKVIAELNRTVNMYFGE
ncbi:MAG: extracellular solute-binding protein [Lachnospiraceae bacterium]|nr:extracellular solute-binding protein [Lachnospiraceae bacterium]